MTALIKYELVFSPTHFIFVRPAEERHEQVPPAEPTTLEGTCSPALCTVERQRRERVRAVRRGLAKLLVFFFSSSSSSVVLVFPHYGIFEVLACTGHRHV